MTNYTAYYRTSTGLNLYAKSFPLTNPWGDDDISLSEGFGGQYSFTADSTKEYVIFVRAGGSPAATDLDEAIIPKNPSIDNVFNNGDVDGLTIEESLKVMLAALAGKISGAGEFSDEGTNTILIRAYDDSKTRITAIVDGDGNRLSLTLDATG